MILPTIHRNGTSPEDLRDGYTAAYTAVREAIEAVQKVEFNARDYYTQGPGAFDAAMEERMAFLRSMKEFQTYLEEHAIHADTHCKP